MSDDRGGGGSLGAAMASSTTPSGSQSWSSRPARPRPSLGIPSNSAQQSGFNFSGIGSGSGSGTNSNGVNTAFAFGVNVGGGAARKTPSLPPLMLTPSPMKPNNRQNVDNEEEERKLAKIMERTNQLQVNGRRIPAHIDDLELLGDLGNGTCGHVVKMRHKPSGQVIAVKQMRRTGNHDETKRIFMDLDVVLKSHDCKEIVLCLGCFITDSDVWICMELMATCFDKLLKQVKQPIPENICGKVAVATLKALHYLKEEHGVIHRDVKPSNILLDADGRIKLCDFGISGRLVDSKAKTRSAGCAAYMAPERIDPPHPSKPDYHYDIRADVWSLGITLVEMATGHFPYKDCKTDFEVLTKVLQDDPPFLPRNSGFSHEFQCFVRDCLLKNYKDRPKYKQLLKHAFIKKYEKEEVDVGAWYRDTQRRLNGTRGNEGSQKHRRDDPLRSGDVLRGSSTSDDPLARASSTDTSAAFKPQPSPRVVRSSLANWRSPTASSTTTSTTSGPHNGIMSGASSVSSSNYHSSRGDRTASSSHPQKSSSSLSGVPSSTMTAVYPSAIGEQQRERERERNEFLRAEREREVQQLAMQRRNSHDRRTSFDSTYDPDGRHRTPHRPLHNQYVTSKPPPAIPSPSSETPSITVTSGNALIGSSGNSNTVGGSLGRHTPSKTSVSIGFGADPNMHSTSNSKGYSSNNYERWAANIAANANMEASNSPALKRISSNPSSSSALHTTTSNSNISTGMYYPHHYTGPTSTSSAYSSPYLPRSSRMHHNTISTGGSSSAYSSPHHQSRYRPNYTSGSISGPSSLQHPTMTTSAMESEQPRSLNVAEEMSLSAHQPLQNQLGESSMPYTRGSPAEKHGERKTAITSSASTVPRYAYRDSPRIAKKFEFTYPGTTSLFAPGSPGTLSGPSSHAPTSGQQFYSRLASGTLGGEEGKSSAGAGYHSLDTVTSSSAGGGSPSHNTTLPQSHSRYQHVYHHHPTTSRRSLSTSGGGNDGLHYGGSGTSSHHYTPSSMTGSGSYMLPHHYNYQQHYSSQHHPHASSDIGGSGGRQSRADRDKDRHRTLIGATSGHHSPSPRDQFVHDQQQFLNAATSSGGQKASGRPRSPSGERPGSNLGARSPGYMSSWKSTLSAWASNTASTNLPSISSLRLRTASSDRASVVPGRGVTSTEDGAYSYVTGDNNSTGFDSRRFQPRFRSWNEKDNYPSAYSSMKR